MNNMKIKVFQARYNAAQKALIALGADAGEIEWREVKDADLRWLEDLEQDAKREMWAHNRQEKHSQNLESRLEVPGPGEGHRKLLWIWEGAGRDLDTSSGLHDGKPSSICSPRLSSGLFQHCELNGPSPELGHYNGMKRCCF